MVALTGSSSSTNADSPYKKEVPQSWDCSLFFELPSICQKHPTFVQARPLKVQTALKHGIKQHFLLKNTKQFIVCYKITSITSILNVWPSMGVIEPETEEVIQISLKPPDDAYIINECLDILITECPCPSLVDHPDEVAKFWDGGFPVEILHHFVIVELFKREMEEKRRNEEIMKVKANLPDRSNERNTELVYKEDSSLNIWNRIKKVWVLFLSAYIAGIQIYGISKCK